MSPAPDRRILGLDLDNTVIDYAEAYRALAPHFDLLDGAVSREAIRCQLRPTPDDDEAWQRFQSLLYTDGLEAAKPAAGVLSLLEVCQQEGIHVVIVSHKTPNGPARFGGRDLRSPARGWLARHRIAPGWISQERVTFHSTAREKVAQIAELAPSWFVDDLEEILAMDGFPAHTKRVLYRAGAPWQERDDGSAIAGFPALAEQVIA